MDRIDLALVAAVDQVLHHRVADLAVLGGGADHRDRIGLHDAVHLLDDLLLVPAGSAAAAGLKSSDDAHVGGRRAVAASANTGFRSISEISGKSATSADTRSIMSASASRSTGFAPRTPRRISAAAMLSSIDSASSRDRGREAEGDVLEHLDEDAAHAEGDQLAERRIGHGADDDFLAAGSICCTCTPRISALASYLRALADDRRRSPARTLPRDFTPTSTPPASVLCRICGRDDLHARPESRSPAASCAASAALCATPSCGTVMP